MMLVLRLVMGFIIRVMVGLVDVFSCSGLESSIGVLMFILIIL